MITFDVMKCGEMRDIIIMCFTHYMDRIIFQA